MAKKSKKNTSKKKKTVKKSAKKGKVKKTAKKTSAKKRSKVQSKKVSKPARPKKKTLKKATKLNLKKNPKKIPVNQKEKPDANIALKKIKTISTNEKAISKSEIKKQISEANSKTSAVSTETHPALIPKKVIRTTFSSAALKEPKKKETHPNQYSFEYIIHASPSLLFEMISTPSGLSEWFANDVNIRDGNFTFIWDGSQQVAKLVAYKELKFVRFQWIDKPDYSFFEFRIEIDELTNEASLIVSDFAEDGDKESARRLWDNEIAQLKKSVGS